MLAFGYQVESVEADSSHRSGAGQAQGGIQGYNPRPVDLSNMTLNREMGFAAEKMAENAHLIWAKKTLDDITAKGKNVRSTTRSKVEKYKDFLRRWNARDSSAMGYTD